MAVQSLPVPDSKLCAQLLFFLLTAQSHPPPRLLAEPSWDLKSHWLQGTPGSVKEVLLCLHASREKTPTTTVTLSNQTVLS